MLSPSEALASLRHWHFSPTQAEAWWADLRQRCPFGLSDWVLPVSEASLEALKALIAALHDWTNTEAYQRALAQPLALTEPLLGYDFHWTDGRWQLIEVNTNPGGLALGLWWAEAHGVALEPMHLKIKDLFTEHYRAMTGAALSTVVIVDAQPTEQYLYPEFVLYQRLLEQHGISALIADASQLQWDGRHLSLEGQPVQMLYNRLTDFALAHYPALSAAAQASAVLISPHPRDFSLHADKQRLCDYSDPAFLERAACSLPLAKLLEQLVPPSFFIDHSNREALWASKKQWFFKPQQGFGSRGVYRGQSITRPTFERLLEQAAIAQKRADPSQITAEDGQQWKWDLRCYAWRGELLWLTPRFYQGQTTNFRVAGGGFGRIVLEP